MLTLNSFFLNPKLLMYVPPSTLLSPCVFSMSMSLLLFCKEVPLYHFLGFTSK